MMSFQRKSWEACGKLNDKNIKPLINELSKPEIIIEINLS